MKEHEAAMYVLKEMIEETGISKARFCRQHGIDSSLFNPSRCTNPDGKPHWPTTGTISKVLKATKKSWTEYGKMVDGMVG